MLVTESPAQRFQESKNGKNAYIDPVIKITESPIFRLEFICNFQMIGRGRTKI